LERHRGVRPDRVHGQRAVVGLALALVRALWMLAETPRPRKHRIGGDVPRLLARRLDADAVGHRGEETAPAFLAHRVHATPGVLAELPAGGELARRGAREGVQRDAVRGDRDPGGQDEGESEEKRAHAYSMPR